MMPIRQILADFVYPEGRDRRDRAERIANTDDLTGTANHRALTLALPTIQADPDVVFLFGDGNDFGLINKTAGHTAGDHVIKEMAKAFLRHTNRVFRRGGDEFVAVVPAVRAEETRLAIEQGFGVVVHLALRFTISCGIGKTLEEAEADMKSRKAAQEPIWQNQKLSKPLLQFQNLRK